MTTRELKLYLVALYRMEDGDVVEIEDPVWVAERSEDRAKAKLLLDVVDMDDEDWEVKILQTFDF